jgi:hypothetical protein
MHSFNAAIDVPRRLSDRERRCPVIVRNNSQRFSVMTRKSNSGVAKQFQKSASMVSGSTSYNPLL